MTDAEETAKAEESYVARSFERDLSDLLSSGSGASTEMLMRSYVRHYKENGILLGFFSGGKALASSFSGIRAVNESGSISRQSIENERYVVISDPLEDAACVLVFAKRIEGVYREFRSFAVICAAAAAVISLLLAAVLLPLLKKLTVPLERLEETADRISGGEFDVRADESGRDEFASLAKSFNTVISVWDENGVKRKEWSFPITQEIRPFAASVSGELIAVGEEPQSFPAKGLSGRLILLDTKALTETELSFLTSAESQWAKLSPDGKLVLTLTGGESEAAFRLYEIATGEVLREFSLENVYGPWWPDIALIDPAERRIFIQHDPQDEDGQHKAITLIEY